MATCKTCQLIERRDRGEAPAWDSILRTGYWDVVHSYDTRLPGWLVLVSRRHTTSVSDLTLEEAKELGTLQRDLSLAVERTVNCRKTYIAQFAEAIEHPHVHFHLVPRMDDLAIEDRGPNVFARFLGAAEQDRVSEARMNEIADQIRAFLVTVRE